MAAGRDDDELLLADDEDSFAEFYRRHVDAVLAYFMRRTHDVEAAADLTAETFAAALLARRRFRSGGPPAQAWLFGIARHKLVDWSRRGRAEDRARRRLGLERIELTDTDRQAIADLQDYAAVAELVEDLPEDQRRAVHERVVNEREYGEIARDLQVSEAVVRQRVSRGISRLRARLKELR